MTRSDSRYKIAFVKYWDAKPYKNFAFLGEAAFTFIAIFNNTVQLCPLSLNQTFKKLSRFWLMRRLALHSGGIAGIINISHQAACAAKERSPLWKHPLRARPCFICPVCLSFMTCMRRFCRFTVRIGNIFTTGAPSARSTAHRLTAGADA